MFENPSRLVAMTTEEVVVIDGEGGCRNDPDSTVRLQLESIALGFWFDRRHDVTDHAV